MLMEQGLLYQNIYSLLFYVEEFLRNWSSKFDYRTVRRQVRRNSCTSKSIFACLNVKLMKSNKNQLKNKLHKAQRYKSKKKSISSIFQNLNNLLILF